MRSQLEFVSPHFPAYPEEDQEINPGRFGRRLADFIAGELPAHGFKVTYTGYEDWGVRIDVGNPHFPLWIGCGNVVGQENTFLCFIEPSKPVVRKWLRKYAAQPVIERLANALESILRSSGKVVNLRWRSDNEGSRV